MCDPQLSRTSNAPLWVFITVKDLLAASGPILVATKGLPVQRDRFSDSGQAQRMLTVERGDCALDVADILRPDRRTFAGRPMR